MATIEIEEEEDEEEKQATEIPLVPQSLIKSTSSVHNHNHNLNDNYFHPYETSSSTRMINIFPPSNHENLRPQQSLHDQDSEVSVSPGAELPVNVVADTWWDIGFNYLRCKVYCVVSRLYDHHSSGFCSRAVSVAGAAMLVALWYLRVQKQRRRRIMHKQSRDQLIGVIKDKDEKISTLLRQVAQMNEILLGLYPTKGRPTT